jgi:hypothetical protein
MPAPLLSFSIDAEKVGYSGVPMNLLVIITNIRFQALTDANVSVVGSLNSGGKPIQIVKASQNFASAIGPQMSQCFAFPVCCPTSGTLEVIATVNFVFQGALYTIQTVDKTPIQPSLKIDCPRNQSVLQVNVENSLPCRIGNVRVRTPTGDVALMGVGLDRGERASAFFATTASTEISWSLPFAARCVQTLTFKEKQQDTKRPPIRLELCGVPQTCPALEPFDVTAMIENESKDILAGEITLAKEGQALLLVGKIDLRITPLKPGEKRTLGLTFIAARQGYFQFPSFTFVLAEGKGTFHTDVGSGVLVVGYAEE